MYDVTSGRNIFLPEGSLYEKKRNKRFSFIADTELEDISTIQTMALFNVSYSVK